MSTERLSPLDASFLQLESDAAHMHVGWILLFEGDPPPLEALRRHVDARLDALPGFRRRLVEAPGGLLLDPIWADDSRFDIARHVHALSLPAPGGPAQVRELAGSLLSGRLDRSRPLWNLYLIHGLEGGGFAIVGQAHHTLVDGIAAVEVGVLLLDGAADAPPAHAAGWSPAPTPALLGVAGHTLQERIRRALVTATATVRAARDPGRLFGAARQARDSAGALVRTAYPPAPHTTLNVALGPERAVGLADLDLEEARALGARHEATVNDVVLASCALALGAFLRRRGDRCAQLRVMVPVNVRAKGTARELGNRISFMFVELPLAETPALEALRTVSEQTRARKASGEAHDLQVAMDAVAWLPSLARRALARMSSRPESFHAVVSNVPGPDQPLFLLGRPLRAAHPAVPLAEGHAVSIGVLSYHGRLHVGVYSDRTAIPDADDLARGVAAAFDALRLADADRPPPPWRRRARERRVAVRAVRGGLPD